MIELTVLIKGLKDTVRHLQKLRYKTGGPFDINKLVQSIEIASNIQLRLKSSFGNSGILPDQIRQFISIDLSLLTNILEKSKTFFTKEGENARIINDRGSIANGVNELVDHTRRDIQDVEKSIRGLGLKYNTLYGSSVSLTIDKKEGACLEVEIKKFNGELGNILKSDKGLVYCDRQSSTRFRRFKCAVFHNLKCD